MEKALCELCGEPMPDGEQMFKLHGYSGPCPKPPKPIIETGVELIFAERKRQTEKEGWTTEHDDTHARGEMAIAAACYAVEGSEVEVHKTQEAVRGTDYCVDAMPFGSCADKRQKHSKLRRLVIAGALIAAEIDRLIRIQTKN